jgi:predicted permease
MWRKLTYLFHRRSADAELELEIESHIEARAADLEAEGLPPREARERARRDFGPALRLREDASAAWQFAWLEHLFRDLRHSLRALRRDPLFAITAVLSLALGIGANTGVFTLLDQLVLRLLPVHEPERLAMIWTTGPHIGNNQGDRSASYPMYQDFQRRATVFDYVFCDFSTSAALADAGGTERITAELVSGNYFQALGIQPAAGRLFSPEQDDRFYKGHPVVVLSHAYWVRRYAADPHVIGRKILVNNYPMEIVGVSAAGFTGLDPSRSPHIRVPIQMKPILTPDTDGLGNRRHQWIHMYGRLKSGVTPRRAAAELQPLLSQIVAQEVREKELRHISPYERARFLARQPRVEIAAAGYSWLRRQYATALTVLMGMAVLILLIACLNVAGLLVARAAARRKELAVRLAIGAGRGGLVRQMLVESALLATAGGALGVLLAFISTRALLSMLPNEDGAQLMLRPEPDLRILAFTCAVALATVLLAGLAPALSSTRLAVWDAIKDGAGVAGSARGRKALVAFQVALSFLLLAGAGLFTRTLTNLRGFPTGLGDIERVVTFELDPAKSGYSIPRLRALSVNLQAALRSTPGVQSTAYAMVPLLREEWDTRMNVEGHTARDGEDMQAYHNCVSPGFFETLGVPLRLGRDFTPADRYDDPNPDLPPRLAIVNRAFAEHFFGHASPIGRRLGWSAGVNPELNVEIIGMVENAVGGGPRNGQRRQVFFAHNQANYAWSVTFYVRAQGDPRALYPAIRRQVAQLDPTLPIFKLATLDEQLDENLSTARLIAWLSTVFGLLAALLAALGLYGVLSFVVARRRREIGLRMALGAPRAAVVWMVLREVVILVGCGLAAGLPAAWGLSRLVSSQLFGVRPTDAVSLAVAAAVLITIAAISASAPARRASAVDPTTALRCE